MIVDFIVSSKAKIKEIFLILQKIKLDNLNNNDLIALKKLYPQIEMAINFSSQSLDKSQLKLIDNLKLNKSIEIEQANTIELLREGFVREKSLFSL